ncbi:PaaX family transcriptional regulator C-terminal domain-containing protein [Comamonas guangdongensis]|uniref:PaaX family transcriptional regulator C-terminal domain-containing protein n=1 Tax=Comamonas guangdongensis TaxID=510515 RepID=A0ABV3ZPR4_9BURK
MLPPPPDTQAAPGARELLLKLLASRKEQALSASEAIRAGALFDIAPNNVRVALNRLLGSELAETTGRGSYRLGSKGLALGHEISAWRHSTERLTAWSGHWIAVLGDVHGRSDRKALRSRDRALSLLGFRELDPGLYIRPDNFSGSAAGVRERLKDLGLAQDIPVFLAQAFDAVREARARTLWDRRLLELAYGQTRRQLEQSLTRLPAMPLEAAAREAWLLGDRAIRQLVFDPLLPEPLVDGGSRQAFIEVLRRYDAAGVRLWEDYLQTAAESHDT